MKSAFPAPTDTLHRSASVSSLLSTALRAARDHIRGALPRDWPVLMFSGTQRETTIARSGPVEFRRMPACMAVQTFVKGDLHAARAIALQRLALYANGHNRDRRILTAKGPLVLQQRSPGHWLAHVAAPDTGAPMPTSRRVHLTPQAGSIVAVLRVRYRPTPDALMEAEARLQATLSSAAWEPIGHAALRLHGLSSTLPLLGWFEVAVPVVARHNGSARLPANEPTWPATLASLPTH